MYVYYINLIWDYAGYQIMIKIMSTKQRNIIFKRATVEYLTDPSQHHHVPTRRIFFYGLSWMWRFKSAYVGLFKNIGMF